MILNFSHLRLEILSCTSTALSLDRRAACQKDTLEKINTGTSSRYNPTQKHVEAVSETDKHVNNYLINKLRQNCARRVPQTIIPEFKGDYGAMRIPKRQTSVTSCTSLILRTIANDGPGIAPTTLTTILRSLTEAIVTELQHYYPIRFMLHQYMRKCQKTIVM